MLFADLVGFTARAERLDPEDVRALLGPYYARVRAELERHGGTVEKFIGDAVMAIFGAPVAHEDDPERAVRAALAIREAIAEMNEADASLELQLRVGVNTGEALVALDARPREGEGMAAGDVVNTAARLQAAAPTNGILVSDKTHRSTERAIEYRDAAAVEAKGKSERIPVWEAVQARARFGVDLPMQSRAQLVGRREELTALADALARARRESALQLVTLVGVPGIGKSRLVAELMELVDEDPELIWWRQGRSLPYGEGVSFWALGEMVKAQAGILESDHEAAAERKLRDAVSHMDEAAWLESHLRPLVGLAVDEAGGERRAEAFAAWRRFFETLADERPLVLVFEDLHWADEGLLDFVDHLAEWATDAPILVVATARPELLERRPAWGGGKRNATTVSLTPLSDEETARLVAALLDRSVIDAETQLELLRRAEGNPLYAEEFVRLLRAGESPEQLPDSVQGMIAARLDVLPPEEKAVLQDAAVVGKVFWLGGLAEATGVEPSQLEEHLHGLERKEFVRRERRSSVEGEREYAFRHGLVRDVAYAQIPRAARAEKHRAAAEWMETLGRSDDTAEMLAHHWLSALELARSAGADVAAFTVHARFALRDAGDRAASLHAHPAAARYYDAALELWPEDDVERARLLLHLGTARANAGLGGEEELVAARSALEAAGDREGAAEAATALGYFVWMSGHRDAAFAHLHDAIELLEREAPSRIKAGVLTLLSGRQVLAGETEEGLRNARAGLAMAEELGLDELRAELLNNIGVARHNGGDFDDRESLAAVEIAREANAPAALYRALLNLSVLRTMEARIPEAWDLQREARAVVTRLGDTFRIRWMQAVHLHELWALGEWEQLERECDAFVAAVEAGSPHYNEGTARYYRAALRLARGDAPGAVREVERALEHAREIKDLQALVPTLASAANVQLEAGDRHHARDYAAELAAIVRGRPRPIMYVGMALALTNLGFDDALEDVLEHAPRTPWWAAARAIADRRFAGAADVVAALPGRSDEAYLRLRAAEGLVEQGKRAEADEQLRRALAFYRGVGATRYVRDAEALLPASA